VILLYILITFILIPITLLIAFLCLQILCGVLFFNKYNTPLTGPRKAVAILIPAHNEAAVIEKTLQALTPQLTSKDRVIVVADNCQDNTADLARKFNLEVIIRTNKQLKGKGYALDFGIQHLKNSPPETLIILDADCIVEDFAIDQLAIAAHLYKTPIQSLYLMKNILENKQNSNTNMFAFFIKNQLRPLGLKALNLPCQLMGSGMAFSWNLINKVDFANSDLVEDMKLGVDFTLQDLSPTFIPSARIYSHFPDDHSIKKIQSTRWEHGHLTVIKSLVPKLLRNYLTSKKLRICFFALDLSIPPLSLFIIVTFMHLFLIGIMTIILLPPAFLIYIISLNLCFILSILTAWFTRGRNLISGIDIIKIPFYILKKLSIYINFMKKRQASWIKTNRNK